jgi:hypothetical protein
MSKIAAPPAYDLKGSNLSIETGRHPMRSACPMFAAAACLLERAFALEQISSSATGGPLSRQEIS